MSTRLSVVEDIRRFNRFYTNTIGLLDETLSQSAYTLTEARVIFELGHGMRPTVAGETGWHGFLGRAFQLEAGLAASDIARQLRIDTAYLTRILRKFSAAGLIETRTDEADGRRRILSLTPAGIGVLDKLQAAANADLTAMISGLSDAEATELSATLRKAARLLGDREAAAVHLRPHRIGDVGWVVERQARLYADEYGWNGEFEALLAEIGAAFIRNFRPGREFCWVAEHAGQRVGAVFLVQRSEEEAQLRMLHVEREARGAGVGALLLETCVEAARNAGYRKLTLWTNDILDAARRLYQRAGFQLVQEDRHHSFGKDLVGQTWELMI